MPVYSYALSDTFDGFIPFASEIGGGVLGSGQFLGQVIGFSGFPYVQRFARSCASIFNGTGSGALINIKKVRLINLSTRFSAFPEVCSAVKLTGGPTVTGGTAASIIKMDSGSADVPAGISVLTKLISISGGTTTSVMDFIAPVFSLSYSTTSGFQKNYGDGDISPVSLIRAGLRTTAIQGLVLRPGEAIAIGTGTAARPGYSSAANIECLFSIGSDSYFTSSDIQLGTDSTTGTVTAYAGDAFVKWMINNGSASDVVTVRGINLREHGGRDIPSFSVEKIVSSIGDGTTITPIKMDTADPNLPAQVQLQTGTLVELYGGEQGRFLPPAFRRGQFPINNIGPGLAGGVTNVGNSLTELLFTGDIWLREGDGVAIIHRVASALGHFRIDIQFTYEPVSGGSAGSGTRSRFVKPASRMGFKT